MRTIHINTHEADGPILGMREVAVCDDAVLNGYLLQIPGHEDRTWNIYRATVHRIEHGLDALFVTLENNDDGPKYGFLPGRQIHPTCLHPQAGRPGAPAIERVNIGDSFLVQIFRDFPNSNKRPQLTTMVRIQGNAATLLPFGGHNQIERKGVRVVGHASRSEMAAISAHHDELGVPDGMTLLINSNWAHLGPAGIGAELRDHLLPEWEAIQAKFDYLASEDRIGLIRADKALARRCLRVFVDATTQAITCDAPAVHDEVGALLASHYPANAIELVQAEPGRAFPRHVREQANRINAPKVELASGAELVFETREALTSVDVNSKKASDHESLETTGLEINNQAADEIARQLHLRNIAGQVIVDFIELRDLGEQRDLIRRVAKVLETNPRYRLKLRTTERLTPLGMMEITRENSGMTVIDSWQMLARLHAEAALAALRERSEKRDFGRLVAKVGPRLAQQLVGDHAVAIANLEREFLTKILIHVDARLRPGEIRFETLPREVRSVN